MSVKMWKDLPSHNEVEDYLKEFFEYLRAGRMDVAGGMVSHAFNDWAESIHVVWQDHYLIHEQGPEDKTFEGGEWKKNLEWLKDLTIKDDMEWITNRTVWVDFVYKGEPSGYIGEFTVKKGDRGFYVERNIFKMA